MAIYPRYATAGLPTTFEVMVTNTSSPSTGKAVHSLTLKPPRGFRLVTPRPGAQRGVRTLVQNHAFAIPEITVKPGATKRIVVTATPPAHRCGKSVLRWATSAYEGATASGPQLALATPASQVGLKVVCPDIAACGDGGPPCSTKLDTNVSSYNVVDNATSGKLHQTLDVGKPLTCAGYTNRDPNWYDSVLTNLQPSPVGAAPFVDQITYLIKGAASNGIGFCMGATYDFITASGGQAPPSKLPNNKPGFIGLLPLCSNGTPPCISSITQAPDASVKSGYDTTLNVQIPERGDPWGGG